MSVRNGIAPLLALSALSFLIACGGSSPAKVIAPPSGAFSNSNLNGTYVFSSTGSDSSGSFLTLVGSLTANGSGGITAGTIDVADPALGVAANQSIATGSTYHVGADGRGNLTLLGTPLGTMVFDLVLTSSSHGLVTEFDNNGSGSGTIDLQAAVSQAQFAGSYTFGFSGVGSTSSYATLGAITLAADGTTTAGIEDINNGGSATTSQSISLSSKILVGSGTTPGTASIAAGAGTAYAFDVYAIDNSHLKFIETDGLLFLSGDAYTQGTSIPTGQLVYTMAGLNVSGTSAAPIAVGGYLTNTGGAISAGLEDFNDAGTVGQVTGVAGNITALTGGRSQLSLSGFVNGAANDVPGNYTFAAYPFSANGIAGVQLLEIDGGFTTGAAYSQTATSLAASQGYGLNLSGFNSTSEEDDIAQFTTTASAFSGIVDLNDQGVTLALGKALTGTFPSAVDGNGRGTASTNYFNYDFYVVNSTTFILLENDNFQVALGTFEQQSSAAAAGAARAAVSMLRPAIQPHAVRQKKD